MKRLIALLALTLLLCASAAAQSPLLICEFRFTGPSPSGTGSGSDEYVELYNRTDQPLDISGVLLVRFDPISGTDLMQPLPGAIIPARGHFLIGDSIGYSLNTYAVLDFDTQPIFSGDFFSDNEGFRLVASNGSVLDSVGFAGGGGNYAEQTPLPRRTQTVPIVQYAYVRKLDPSTGSCSQDTDDNAADFVLVSTMADAFALAAGGTTQSTLGAPGPENLSSPVQRNATIKSVLIDPLATCSTSTQPAYCPENHVRDTTPHVCNGGVAPSNCTMGTLKIRRRFINNTGQTITRLRFRVVDITTLNSPGYTPGGSQADIRGLDAVDIIVTTTSGNMLVRGTTIEQPPNQPKGGGLNSSLTVTLPGGALAPGASISVEFHLGVQQSGAYRFYVDREALP